jgi:PLD-like domain
MQFITQPFGAVRLGDFLLTHFADPQWISFRAAIAFVKRSGTLFVRQPLQAFSNRAEVRISVGIDLNGTSREGLTDLLEATPQGQVFVYRNNGPSTFHPKVYVFKSAHRADVLVGSGNLTRGGLYTNYEASLAVSLDLADQQDAAFLQVVEATLDTWSQPLDGICYLVTPELIEQLIASGLVRTEAELQAAQQAAAVAAQAAAATVAPTTVAPGQQQAPAAAASLFVTVNVPQPPVATQPQAETAAENAAEALEAGPVVVVPPPGILPTQEAGPSCFVMTLQTTDVGVGQTTAGTSRRSPEVFIPLAALDQNPDFWTFPNSFVADAAWDATHPNDRRNGFGKLDRNNVPMRIGGVQAVNMFFNPRKGDFRLRNEALRSEGNVGDILLVRRVDPTNGFEYDIQVAPQGSPLFQQLQPFCIAPVPNSQKRFGYF